MGRQIIKQPDETYCVYSSIIDHLVTTHATEDELKDFYKEEHGKKGVESVERILSRFKDGLKPYHQFTLTFDEMIEKITSVHGEFKVEYDEYTLYEKDFKENKNG